MTVSFDQALERLGEARQQYESACLSVWHAAEREHPQILSMIRKFGWDDRQAAAFLCTPHRRWNNSPAAVVNAGRGDEVIELIEQTLSGMY